jgi:adhesin transport system membrane fusion protein
MKREYLEPDSDQRSGRLIILLSASLAVFIAWAGFFEIDQTVHTTGQVILSARTQVIQVADGGILRELPVQEGQSVKAGQLLAVLEKDRAKAGFEESQGRIMSLKIAMTRVKAEIANTRPVYSKEFQNYPEFIAAQEGLYFQRRQSLQEELKTLQEALQMAESEKRMNDNLLKAGDVSELDVLRAKRQVSELQGKVAAVKNKYLQEARLELARLADDLASQQQKLHGAENVLAKTDILAPMDGVIKSMKVFTMGGVLRPGDELMQISPVGDSVFIEARVLPADVGQLEKGQQVNVSLDAYDYSLYGMLSGELVDISPDTLSESTMSGAPAVNPMTGQPAVYYKVHIKLSAQQDNPKVSAITIKPGMTASIDIRTGTRNLLAYLLKPVIKTFSNSLNER